MRGADVHQTLSLFSIRNVYGFINKYHLEALSIRTLEIGLTRFKLVDARFHGHKIVGRKIIIILNYINYYIIFPIIGKKRSPGQWTVCPVFWSCWRAISRVFGSVWSFRRRFSPRHA